MYDISKNMKQNENEKRELHAKSAVQSFDDGIMKTEKFLFVAGGSKGEETIKKIKESGWGNGFSRYRRRAIVYVKDFADDGGGQRAVRKPEKYLITKLSALKTIDLIGDDGKVARSRAKEKRVHNPVI